MTNILCINGGGVRGIIPLIIIKKLNKYNNILDKIDIVSGSSIGAIISCCLVLPDKDNNYKYNIDQLINLFIYLMNRIFNVSWFRYIYSLNGLIISKYDDKIINDILYELFNDMKLNQLLKNVIIPSYDLNNNKSIIFNSIDHGEMLIRDILRGTTAAPTYFNPYEFIFNKNKMKLIDGSIIDNNTSRICLFNNIKDKELKIINLGTGYINDNINNNYGIIKWLPKIINIIMNGEINEDINECKLLLNDKYLYIDLLINNKYYKLDKPIYIDYYIEQTNKYIDNSIINEYIKWYNL